MYVYLYYVHTKIDCNKSYFILQGSGSECSSDAEKAENVSQTSLTNERKDEEAKEVVVAVHNNEIDQSNSNNTPYVEVSNYVHTNFNSIVVVTTCILLNTYRARYIVCKYVHNITTRQLVARQDTFQLVYSGCQIRSYVTIKIIEMNML